MYPTEGKGLLDVRKARKELAILEIALEKYRQVCERLVSDAEIVALANEARKRIGINSSTS
jgi:hypothetical protein